MKDDRTTGDTKADDTEHWGRGGGGGTRTDYCRNRGYTRTHKREIVEAVKRRRERG